MTGMFREFRTGVHSIFQALGQQDCYRTTGDCSPRALSQEIR